MKLKFEKNIEGQISVKIEDKDFLTVDYIEMIKEIKNKKNIEVEFGENISEEDKNSINSMLVEINSIGNTDNVKEEKIENDEDEEQINVEDIPF